MCRSFGYQPVEGIHLYFASRGLQVRKVLSFQGFIADVKNKLAAGFLIPRMDANIVVSRGLKNWLENSDNLKFKNKLTLIYNGADSQRLLPCGNNLKKELGLSENTRLIGMIGNFYTDPRKDQLTLCQALPQVFQENGDVHCVFAGRIEDGNNPRYQMCVDFCVNSGIAEKVHFLGERTDIPDILKSLDIFIFSSLYEGLPVAATEAMLAKIPLIVSDIEPLLEISQNGEYTEVFPTGDENELAGKINKLLTNDILRREISERAFSFAGKNFSIEAHLEKLKDLYSSLVDQK